VSGSRASTHIYVDQGVTVQGQITDIWAKVRAELSVVIHSHRLADVLYIYICCFITKILSSCRWSIKIHLSCTVIEIQSLKEFGCNDVDLLGSRDVIGHVTIGLGLATFLLVINDDHASILHGYRDTEPQRFSTPPRPLCHQISLIR